MSKHSQPSKVPAIELNPLAYHSLRENISLNRVEDIVEPVLGDCAQCAPVNEADRVVMGMVQVTDRCLVKGIEALRPRGFLHYHQTIPSWLYPQAAMSDVVKAVNALGWQADPEMREGKEVLSWCGPRDSGCTHSKRLLA